MGNSWWSSSFGLWASKHFITHRALLKPFDLAMFMCIAVHTGRCEREGRGAEASSARGIAGGVCIGKEKKTPNHKPKNREWNNCRTKSTDATVRTQQHQLQFSSSLLSGQSYLETCSWLFTSLKPSTRTVECFSFSRNLPRLHRNNPKQGHSLNLMSCIDQTGLTSGKDH